MPSTGYTDFAAHKNVYHMANELQLIDPSLITFAHQHDGLMDGKTYIVEPNKNDLLITNDQVVTVNYYSSHPNVTDWIAAFSPALTNPVERAPVKFGLCDIDHNYLSTGYGTLR